MSKLPFKILGIEHVGIAVKDLNIISDIFGDLLGLNLHRREKVDDQQVITDIYHVGKGKLEFLKATSPDSPITKFMNNIILYINFEKKNVIKTNYFSHILSF